MNPEIWKEIALTIQKNYENVFKPGKSRFCTGHNGNQVQFLKDF